MIRKERVTETFVELAKIDSISLEERKMADVLKKKLENLGFTVEEDQAGDVIGGNAGNLYAYRSGELKGEPILFSGHLDTVEPGRGKCPVVHEDGRVTSDGTTVLGADDLSGVTSILEAIESLQEEGRPTRDLELVISAAEEKHLLGSAAFDYRKVRAKEAYVLDLEAEVGMAAYKAPSLAVFQADFFGRSAHAGFNPQEGVHAVAMAAEAVSRMKLGWADENTTVNVSKIQGGMPSTNVVPDHCMIQGEVRSGSHERLLQELEYISGIFDEIARAHGGTVKIEITHRFRGYETNLSHPVAKRWERACLANGVKPKWQRTFGGSDLNHFVDHGIEGLVVGSAMYRVHSKEEFTRVEDMVKNAEILESLMTDEEILKES